MKHETLMGVDRKSNFAVVDRKSNFAGVDRKSNFAGVDRKSNFAGVDRKSKCGISLRFTSLRAAVSSHCTNKNDPYDT